MKKRFFTTTFYANGVTNLSNAFKTLMEKELLSNTYEPSRNPSAPNPNISYPRYIQQPQIQPQNQLSFYPHPQINRFNSQNSKYQSLNMTREHD